MPVNPTVSIRAPLPEDREYFLQLMIKNQSYLQPWISPPLTHESYTRFLEKAQGKTSRSFFVVAEKEIVGVVNINEIVFGLFQNGFLGYYGVQKYSGYGFMLRGLQLVIEYALLHMHLHRLEANIQPENNRSKSLVRALGFQREGYSVKYLQVNGEWCDHERWALLQEFWRPINFRK